MTYRWKALDEGYDFASNVILIEGLHTKLSAPKVVGVITLGISGLSLGSPGTKCHLGVGPMAMHKVYYKGEGGGFSQVWAVMSLCLPIVHSCINVLQLHTNQLVVRFCRFV